jgi:hypothetical protein
MPAKYDTGREGRPVNRMGILVHTSLTVSRDYEPVEGDTTPSGGNSLPGIAVIWRANTMIQQEGTVAPSPSGPSPSGPSPDPVPTMSARLRWWASAIGMVLAGFVTFALAGNIALDAMTATENPRWPVYLMMALVVSMLWSGASLLRKKSNQGIFVFVLSVAFGLPLVALVLAVSFGD